MIYGSYRQVTTISSQPSLDNNFYMFSVIRIRISIHLEFVSHSNQAERAIFYQLDDHFSNPMMKAYGFRQRLLLFPLIL